MIRTTRFAQPMKSGIERIRYVLSWSEYSVNLALGCVFDPTSKFDFITFCFKRLYPTEYEEKVNKLKEILYSLFSEYTNNTSASLSSLASSSRDTQSSISSSSYLERRVSCKLFIWDDELELHNVSMVAVSETNEAKTKQLESATNTVAQ